MLEAIDITARRGTAVLFNRLRLRVEAAALLVTGRNGSGKTTLLRVLAGLTQPDDGAVTLNGSATGAMRAHIAFAGHAAALKDELTVEENLRALAELGGEPRDARRLVVGTRDRRPCPPTGTAGTHAFGRTTAPGHARAPRVAAARAVAARRACDGARHDRHWRARGARDATLARRRNRRRGDAPAARMAARPCGQPCTVMSTVAATALNEPDHGVFSAIRWAVAHDLRVALRSRAELAVQLLFYVIVVSLFPLASSPDRVLLAALGPGVLWVAALLASLLALPRLFASDFADGTLEQVAMSPYPLPALVGGKALAHWLTTGLPVVVLAPILGLQYALDADVLKVVVLAPPDRHADPVAARRHRCGADPRRARRRRPARIADPAPVRARADFRRRRRRRVSCGPVGVAQHVAPRGGIARCTRGRAVCHGCSRTHRDRLT